MAPQFLGKPLSRHCWKLLVWLKEKLTRTLEVASALTSLAGVVNILGLVQNDRIPVLGGGHAHTHTHHVFLDFNQKQTSEEFGEIMDGNRNSHHNIITRDATRNFKQV